MNTIKVLILICGQSFAETYNFWGQKILYSKKYIGKNYEAFAHYI